MNRLGVIVNADDFGLNKSSTEAIASSLRMGLITDTTILANGEDFDEAARLSRLEFVDKVGIHFNITEGIPLTDKIKGLQAFCDNGHFHGKINRLRFLKKTERNAIFDELTAQCLKLKEVGIKITHADSHHHIHTAIFIAPIVLRVCRENDIKIIRIHRNIGRISKAKRMVKAIFNMMLRRCFTTTDFMGGADDIDLSKPIKGIVEIMVHPAIDNTGNIVDKRANVRPLLSSIRYWDNSKKTSYIQL